MTVGGADSSGGGPCKMMKGGDKKLSYWHATKAAVSRSYPIYVGYPNYLFKYIKKRVLGISLVARFIHIFSGRLRTIICCNEDLINLDKNLRQTLAVISEIIFN